MIVKATGVSSMDNAAGEPTAKETPNSIKSLKTIDPKGIEQRWEAVPLSQINTTSRLARIAEIRIEKVADTTIDCSRLIDDEVKPISQCNTSFSSRNVASRLSTRVEGYMSRARLLSSLPSSDIKK